jgi:NitT/TauT family transport system substrate-binding protein
MQMVIEDNSLDRTIEMLGARYDIPILGQPELAKQTLRDYIASWQANGALLETAPDRWDRIYTETVAVGLVPAGLDADAWFTNDLLGVGPS